MKLTLIIRKGDGHSDEAESVREINLFRSHNMLHCHFHIRGDLAENSHKSRGMELISQKTPWKNPDIYREMRRKRRVWTARKPTCSTRRREPFEGGERVATGPRAKAPRFVDGTECVVDARPTSASRIELRGSEFDSLSTCSPSFLLLYKTLIFPRRNYLLRSASVPEVRK